MKCLKSSIEVFEVLFHFTTFPVGWVGGLVGGGWVRGWLDQGGKKANLSLSLSLVELS